MTVPASPRVVASLRHSLRLLRARFFALAALGTAIVLSLLAVCFGLGVVLAPWLLCELLALQLGAAIGHEVRRERSWLAACVVLFGGVLLIASVGWLSLLGLGSDAGTREGFALPHDGALLAAASAVVSLVFVLPFLYAPLVSLEGRAGLGGAVLESARLVVRGGILQHFALSLCAHAVQVAPLLAAAALAWAMGESDAAPAFALCGLPLLALSVPLGQGMIVSAYAARRGELPDRTRTRLAARPPLGLVVLWAVLVSAPVLSFSLLSGAFLRPSRLAEGRLPEQGELLAAFAPLRGTQRVQPSGTALEISASARGAWVTASDGGGVGPLPLRSHAPVEALRVVRLRDDYGIEVLQAGRSYLTFIDRAGVRLDDDLRTRLLDRVPSWALLLMLASLFCTAVALLPVLGALGALRREYTLEPGARAAPRELSLQRARTLRGALAAGLLLAPLSALSLYWAARSLVG